MKVRASVPIFNWFITMLCRFLSGLSMWCWLLLPFQVYNRLVLRSNEPRHIGPRCASISQNHKLCNSPSLLLPLSSPLPSPGWASGIKFGRVAVTVPSLLIPSAGMQPSLLIGDVLCPEKLMQNPPFYVNISLSFFFFLEIKVI